jgi:NAD(P)H-flavin reductase
MINKSLYGSIIQQNDLHQRNHQHDPLFLNQEDQFFPVKHLLSTADCRGLKRLTVQVPREVAAQYKTPGQYVRIRPVDGNKKVSYYAITNTPALSALEDPSRFIFLVKDVESNQYLLSTPTVELEMSFPLGKGFQIQQSIDQIMLNCAIDGPRQITIIVAATGSAVAPIISTLEHIIEFNVSVPIKVFLYFGSQTSHHIPQLLIEKLSYFKHKSDQLDVTFVPVFSRLPPDLSGFEQGYVQSILEKEIKERKLNLSSTTLALVCGQR